MEIYLPKLFEIMSEHDVVTILEWYVAPGDVIEPGVSLLKVRAPGRTITIPTPPEVQASHRVVQIAKAAQSEIRLGDLLIKLEPMES